MQPASEAGLQDQTLEHNRLQALSRGSSRAGALGTGADASDTPKDAGAFALRRLATEGPGRVITHD